jgi:hypothetical protein
MRAFFLLCLLPSTIFAADIRDLVSASNDFEVEMIDHERVLERNPAATELAASTLKYARAKERYFVVLRKSILNFDRHDHRENTEDTGGGQVRGDFFGLWRNSREALGGGHGLDAETG